MNKKIRVLISVLIITTVFLIIAYAPFTQIAKEGRLTNKEEMPSMLDPMANWDIYFDLYDDSTDLWVSKIVYDYQEWHYDVNHTRIYDPFPTNVTYYQNVFGWITSWESRDILLTSSQSKGEPKT